MKKSSVERLVKKANETKHGSAKIKYGTATIYLSNGSRNICTFYFASDVNGNWEAWDQSHLGEDRPIKYKAVKDKIEQFL